MDSSDFLKVLDFFFQEYDFYDNYDNFKLFFYHFKRNFNIIFNNYCLINDFIFYYLCKLKNSSLIDFRFFLKNLFIYNFLFVDYSLLIFLDMLNLTTRYLTPISFFKVTINKVIKCNRFILRIDHISYIYMRYFSEYLRLAKYNEYISNHPAVYKNRDLAYFLYTPNLSYTYTIHIFRRYRILLRTNKYFIYKFKYKSFLPVTEYSEKKVNKYIALG